jgi:hypothetical protein
LDARRTFSDYNVQRENTLHIMPEERHCCQAWSYISLMASLIIAIFSIFPLMFFAVPDWSERAPTIEHECIVLSKSIQDLTSSRGEKCKSGCSRRVGDLPVVRVRLVASNTTHSAMRYRTDYSSFSHEPGYSMFEPYTGAAFLARFPINESVPCYQSGDGTVKLEEEPPELTHGTYVVYVCWSLIGGNAFVWSLTHGTYVVYVCWSLGNFVCVIVRQTLRRLCACCRLRLYVCCARATDNGIAPEVPDVEAGPARHADSACGSADEACCVCMGCRTNARLVPCGHRTCKECAKKLSPPRCPLCRHEVQKIVIPHVPAHVPQIVIHPVIG